MRIIILEKCKILANALVVYIENLPGFSVTGSFSSLYDNEFISSVSQGDILIIGNMQVAIHNYELCMRLNKINNRLNIVLFRNVEEQIRFSGILPQKRGFYLRPEGDYNELCKTLLLIARGKSNEKRTEDVNIANETNGLTRRELEVMKHILSGKKNSEIALMLNVSIKTISSHRFNLMKKLNVHNSAQLYLHAIENKLNN